MCVIRREREKGRAGKGVEDEESLRQCVRV